jgi:hypothetical protein
MSLQWKEMDQAFGRVVPGEPCRDNGKASGSWPAPILREFGWVFGSGRDAELGARALARVHGLSIRRAAA